MRRVGHMLVLAGGFALAAGCGDDGGGGAGTGASGAGPSATRDGERCEQPGFTATDCTCGGATRGHRNCRSDNTWSACSCPPREEACKEGDPVECMCPGESTPRTATCLLGGTFDCPCPAGGGGMGAGDADGG